MYCRNPRLRSPAARLAGKPFAAAAHAQMFQGNRLTAPFCVATVQALVFLLTHKMWVNRTADVDDFYYSAFLDAVSLCTVDVLIVL